MLANMSLHFHLEMLNLKSDFAQYNYVNQSGCNQALTINDGKDFTQTLV